jgi:hypothetical protein
MKFSEAERKFNVHVGFGGGGIFQEKVESHRSHGNNNKEKKLKILSQTH